MLVVCGGAIHILKPIKVCKRRGGGEKEENPHGASGSEKMEERLSSSFFINFLSGESEMNA